MDSNFERAMKKVGDFCLFNDLPSDRNDVLWTDLKKERELTFAELSALKNVRCFLEGIELLTTNFSFAFLYCVYIFTRVFVMFYVGRSALMLVHGVIYILHILRITYTLFSPFPI